MWPFAVKFGSTATPSNPRSDVLQKFDPARLRAGVEINAPFS
jgi:hypothetical protein